MKISFSAAFALLTSQMEGAHAYTAQYHATPNTLAQTSVVSGKMQKNLAQSEQTDVVNSERLPLEEGKVLTVHPAADGSIPEGNCCQPVIRSAHAVKLDKDTAKTFVDEYLEVANAGVDLIWTDVQQALADYPNTLRPSEIFNLGENGNAVLEVVDPLVDHFDLDGTPSNDNGDFPKADARSLFRDLVNTFETGLDIVDMAVEVMKVTEHDDLASFETKQETFHSQVNAFYDAQLTPARFEYELFSRVPIPNRTVRGLERAMVDKLKDFRDAARNLRSLGIEYYPQDEMKEIA